MGDHSREGYRQNLGDASKAVVLADAALEAAVNAIIHHFRFKHLEASWRGLKVLTDQVTPGAPVKVRVLNVTRGEIERDDAKALDFDQSELFKKVYSQEFDMPGGEPFGLLVGDYELHIGANDLEHSNDISVLRAIAKVAAAAFAPFVASVGASSFGLDDYADLTRPIDLHNLLRRDEYREWQSFRRSPEAKFVGLVLPHVLMRLPYRDDGARRDGFAYDEESGFAGAKDYLWGNAAYGFAAVVLRAFESGGWLAEIRGAQQDEKGLPLASGGVVEGLPIERWDRDRAGSMPRIVTEVLITARREKEFAEQGFISLCHARPTPWAVFYNTPSVHEPERYESELANANAHFGTQLQYTLCVSRFAHYVKVIAREKIGLFTSATDLEQYLREWLREYTTANVNLSQEDKARMPLRAAKVKVTGDAAKPGSLICTLLLVPHYQLEQIVGMLSLDISNIDQMSALRIEVFRPEGGPGGRL